VVEEPMPKKPIPQSNKEILVDPEAKFKKHPSSEGGPMAKISIPQSFTDYLKSLDYYLKKLTDETREKENK
jgi:hypothetical protein